MKAVRINESIFNNQLLCKPSSNIQAIKLQTPSKDTGIGSGTKQLMLVFLQRDVTTSSSQAFFALARLTKRKTPVRVNVYHNAGYHLSLLRP